MLFFSYNYHESVYFYASELLINEKFIGVMFFAYSFGQLLVSDQIYIKQF